MNYLKQPTFRSEAWRRAVASLPCVCCMKDGPSQAAHANHRGKGMAHKASDVFVAPLCPTCHAEFDQGKRWSKQEKRELMDEWILQTIDRLARDGMIKALLT